MLTDKQEAFRKAHLESGNAELAYRAVYNCTGMAPSNVRQNAHRELARIRKDESDSHQSSERQFDESDSHQANGRKFDESDSHQISGGGFDESDSHQWLDFNNTQPQPIFAAFLTL